MGSMFRLLGVGVAWLAVGCGDEARAPHLPFNAAGGGAGTGGSGGTAAGAAGAGGAAAAGGTSGAAGSAGTGAGGAAGGAGAGGSAGSGGTGTGGTGGSGTGGTGTGGTGGSGTGGSGTGGTGGVDGPTGDCTLDPAVVHVVGDFDNRYFVMGSVITPLSPVSPRPRSCFALPADDTALIRRDGKVLYTWGIPGQTQLRELVADTIRWEERVVSWYSPSSPQDDDLPVNTPACGTDGPFRVHVFPDTGALLYDCYNSGGGSSSWYDESGATHDTNGFPVLAAGYGGRVLTVEAIHAGNVRTALSGINMTLPRALRGVASGFWVVKDASGGGWQRYVIGFDGVATVQGAYPALPSGYTVSASTVTEPRVFALAPNGDLYVVAYDAQYLYAVFRLPLDGAAGIIVYQEADVPAENWDTPQAPPDPAAHFVSRQPLLLVGP